MKLAFFAFILAASTLQAQFSVIIQVDQNIDCHGNSNGALTAVVTPVGSAYTFAWSNGESVPSITDLTAGDYSVTVQNAAGGSAIATAILSEPDELILTSLTELPLVVNPTGTVEVETSGGTLPYAFQWTDASNNPFSNEEDLVDAPAGMYAQAVTDAHGCTAVLSPVELVAVSGAVEVFEPSLKVFPNPASSEIFIEIPEGAIVAAQVFNAMGQMLETHTLQGPLASVSVDNWPTGLYSIAIPALNKSAKVLVQR